MEFDNGGEPLTLANLRAVLVFLDRMPDDLDLCGQANREHGLVKLWVDAELPEEVPSDEPPVHF